MLTFQITIKYLTSYNVPEDTTWFRVPSSIQPISLLDKYKADVKGQFWKCFFFICRILLLDRYLKRKTVIYNLECQNPNYYLTKSITNSDTVHIIGRLISRQRQTHTIASVGTVIVVRSVAISI